jgi:hypothetical protein
MIYAILQIPTYKKPVGSVKQGCLPVAARRRSVAQCPVGPIVIAVYAYCKKRGNVHNAIKKYIFSIVCEGVLLYIVVDLVVACASIDDMVYSPHHNIIQIRNWYPKSGKL